MFANDLGRAEQVRHQVEAVPLAVKIRYLCEFMASDHSMELSTSVSHSWRSRPGFNEKLPCRSCNSWYKTSFQDAWDAFSKKTREYKW